MPPYLQIAQQIRQALVAGVLVPGDQLPTVKEVVTRAGDQPEHGVQGLPGAGARGPGGGSAGRRDLRPPRGPPGPPPGTHAALARSLARWVDRARAAGLDDSSIEALLRDTLYAGGDEAIA